MTTIRMRLPVIATTLLALLGSTACPAPEAAAQRKRRFFDPDKIELERDIEYGAAGDRALKLDVLLPKQESDQPRPAIVWIHGGGWRGGNKASGLGRIAPLVATGEYVGFTVEYRLSGEAKWPAQVHDCKAAIRWIKAHAQTYNIDPQRIGVWGSSAGGHLVSLLGTSGDVEALEGENGTPDESTKVACVVDFCGPSDFFSFEMGENPRSPVGQLFGGKVSEHRAAAQAASPVTHVSSDDPPFLIMHGTEDRVVPIQQAERLHKQLQENGVSSVFVKIEGGGHGIGGAEVNRRVAAFFAKHLLGSDDDVSAEPIKYTRPARKKRPKKPAQ